MMTSEAEDATTNVMKDTEEGDVPGGTFGTDSAVGSSESFHALKKAYGHVNQKYQTVNEECKTYKLENSRLSKENNWLKQQIQESGDRNISFDILPDVAERNKNYLLKTKVEELEVENNKLRTEIKQNEQSKVSKQELDQNECENENCRQNFKLLTNVNQDLFVKSKQQELKIQELKKQLEIFMNEEKQKHDKEIDDADMETDGSVEPLESTDLVEFDVQHFLSEYNLLKLEVRNLLKEVKHYRELNRNGMLYIRKRKQESDMEMEDFEKRLKTVRSDSDIKRPPKGELQTSELGQVPPILNESDEDLYGASTSFHAERAMESSEEANPFKRISSSYDQTASSKHPTHFQTGSAPNFATSGYMTSPHSSAFAANSPSSSGSGNFRIMQESGEDLLPPRNPPNIKDMFAGGRNSPEFFTPAPATYVKERGDLPAHDMTAVEPEWTSCPICSRKFDRSLFSAEFINEHVNSHFDGTSEYEFVDILTEK